ncbi:MAG TPA: DUF4129 domain-containing protein [Candidatus Acidoferrales bacterium]|jgi:hypothetical protein|nr:DUF4129 domain-containing protein [Candidatus Acidoferrales bacterium]
MGRVTLELAWRFNTCLQQCFADMQPVEMPAIRLNKQSALPQQLCVACLAVLLLFFAFPALRASADSSAATTTLTIEQYESELDRLSSAAAKLSDDPTGIGTLRDSLPSGWSVTANGSRFEVSAEWLKSSLDGIEENYKAWKKKCEGSSGEIQKYCNENGDEKNLKEWRKQCAKSAAQAQKLCSDILDNLWGWKIRSEELAGQLHKMRSEAGSLADTPQPPADAPARAKLDNILNGREFVSMRQGESWIGRVWDQVGRWIDWILEHAVGRLLDKGPVRTVILWTLIGGVFLLIAVWVVRILSRMARTETLRVEGAFPPGRNWREWAQEAMAAARGGDFRTALHSAYWAGVYRLADAGAWKLDRARTPREYLRLLKNPPAREANLSATQPAADAARVSALVALTRSMESAWYGYIPATQQDFDSAIENLETLGCKLRSTAQTANS